MRILTHSQKLDAILIFTRAAGQARWEPGARAIAIDAMLCDADARRTYAMLAAERAMSPLVGERVRRPVARTIRRRAAVR